MSTLREEIEEASRGRKVPLENPDQDKENLQRARAKETQKSFDKVNADRDAIDTEVTDEDYARGSEKETVSDKITKH